MNGSDPHASETRQPTRDEMLSALFANLVIQTTNLAMIFLGRVPHPETGKLETDLQSARLFIDQLEMLEAKTRGNLDAQERQLLAQNLTALRLAFVEATDRQPQPSRSPAAAKPAAPTPDAEPGNASDDAETRKKFTKKY